MSRRMMSAVFCHARPHQLSQLWLMRREWRYSFKRMIRRVNATRYGG